MTSHIDVPVKKTRGRKKKTEMTQKPICEPSNNNIILTIEETEENLFKINNDAAPVVAKKRGRKPRGGKLIEKNTETLSSASSVVNVILHLKCSMQDLYTHNHNITQIVTDPLCYNPTIPPTIMSFNVSENTPFSFYNSTENTKQVTETIEMPKTDIAYAELDVQQNKDENQIASVTNKSSKIEVIENTEEMQCENCNDDEDDDSVNIKDINAKLKRLKIQLYKNTNHDKKSACFWCTYEYDNQPCYIPKYEMDGTLFGYGSFCRPECAVAYLMEEKIDDSTKFEIYHLLNQIYGKVYNFKRNIKPAPNPYYLLDKFYGTLSIQEYRKLLKSEHMLLVIDKPMTRLLPELHEDNEDFTANIYGGKSQTGGSQSNSNSGGMYKVKRQSEKQKGPSKSSIMKENFGLTA